ncbi:MAG: hypothetical protein QW602_01800 [Candidatus Aenigmatarchaeota archaeon]
MKTLEIYKKSLADSLKFKRVFPFFTLYFISSFISLFFLLPLISILPNFLILKLTQENLNLILINSSILVAISFIVFVFNCWLSGALVYDVWRKEGLNAGLKFSKKLLPQILGLFFFLTFINLFLYFFGSFGLLLRFLVSFVFLLSLPSIVINREDFLEAMKRSYSLVIKNLLTSFLFWLFLYLIYFSILFSSFFLVILSLSPLFSQIVFVYQIFSTYGELSQAGLIQIIGLITNNPERITVALAVLSFFLSYSYVFLTTAKTYYFLFLTRKKLISSKQS